MHKTQQRNRLISGILAALVIIAVIFGALYFGPTARSVRADEAAKNHVTSFGAEFKNVSLLGDDATVAQAIEQIRSNAAWYARDEKNIAEFLKNTTSG